MSKARSTRPVFSITIGTTADGGVTSAAGTYAIERIWLAFRSMSSPSSAVAAKRLYKLGSRENPFAVGTKGLRVLLVVRRRLGRRLGLLGRRLGLLGRRLGLRGGRLGLRGRRLGLRGRRSGLLGRRRRGRRLGRRRRGRR